MSRIVFEDEYVIVLPTFKEVVPHKHPFLHIFFLGDGSICDEAAVVGSGMVHTMQGPDKCRLFLMIDPTSDLADYLNSKVLTGGGPEQIKLEVPLIIDGEDDLSISNSVKKCLKDNGFCICSCINRACQIISISMTK